MKKEFILAAICALGVFSEIPQAHVSKFDADTINTISHLLRENFMQTVLFGGIERR